MHMFSFKRLISAVIAFVILVGLTPVTLAVPAPATMIQVTNWTTSFNPSAGQSAQINYQVTGPNPATDVLVRVYVVDSSGSTGGRICPIISRNFRGVIDGTHSSRAAGTYTAQWNGRYNNSQTGDFLPSGLYCYVLTWGNPPSGAEGLREGLITLNTQQTPPPPGGSNPPGSGLNTPQPSDIAYYVDRSIIDPYLNETAVIYYTVNRQLSYGLTLDIRNSAGTIVRTPISNTSAISVGNYSAPPWNGKNASNVILPEGTYRYVFTSNGIQLGYGYIQIRYTPAPPPPPPPPASTTITHSVDHSWINPGQTATITYSINNAALPNGLNLVIRNQSNNLIRTLYSTTARVEIGSRTATWNGRYNDGTDLPTGNYKYVFSSAGVEYTYGWIEVRTATPPPPPPPPPSTTITHSIDRTWIIPGDTATITYSINNAALPNGLSLVVRNQSNNLIRTLYSTTARVEIGSRTDVWNGRYNDGVTDVPSGNYKYVFSSAGVEYTYGWIEVRTATPPPPPPPPPSTTITHSIDRTWIIPGDTATITYSINNAALPNGLNLVIRNQSNNLIRTLYSTTARVEISSRTAVWNGRYNDETDVPSGNYKYVFSSAGVEYAYGWIEVRRTAQNAPVINDQGPTLSSFNPNQNQTTTLRFSVNQDVQAFVRIYDSNNSFLRTLMSPAVTGNNNVSAGVTNLVAWDGRYGTNLSIVPNGTYTYRIEAFNTNGAAEMRSGTLYVQSGTYQNAPVITDQGPTLSSFNPSQNQTTTLRFSVNQNARASVRIYYNGSIVRNAMYGGTTGSYNVTAGITNLVSWDGRNDSGSLLSDATYTYIIEANNDNGAAQSVSGNITIASSYSGNLQITNLYADPNPFNPETQNTYIRFSLNHPAYATVTVTRQSDGVFVKTVSNDQSYGEGQNSVVWAGTDLYGSFVQNGVYVVRVDARSSTWGNDYETATFTVSRTTYGSTLQITNSGASPSSFDPWQNQSTQINFTVNMVPTSVNVRLYRSSNNVLVRELPLYTISSYSYRATWDGRDTNNAIVPAESYYYRIEVYASGQNAQVIGYVTVGPGGVNPPPPAGDCGNFSDVSRSNSLCSAIEFVKSRGIFMGYPDGTLGLNRVIQRAELAAVMQRAFGYTLDSYNPSTDGNLGYRDLPSSSEWYMPYIKTFSRFGIMTGYPDGRMRPEQTMNTAELYKVFLEAALRAPQDITNFELPRTVNYPPYSDIVIESGSRWFLRYAEFARLNALVTTTRFYPARGITRGQVIRLIYDTHAKGLIRYSGTNYYGVTDGNNW